MLSSSDAHVLMSMSTGRLAVSWDATDDDAVCWRFCWRCVWCFNVCVCSRKTLAGTSLFTVSDVHTVHGTVLYSYVVGHACLGLCIDHCHTDCHITVIQHSGVRHSRPSIRHCGIQHSGPYQMRRTCRMGVCLFTPKIRKWVWPYAKLLQMDTCHLPMLLSWDTHTPEVSICSIFVLGPRM